MVHYLLTNEAYTGAAVWGVKSKDEKAQEPVRVENAWPRAGVEGDLRPGAAGATRAGAHGAAARAGGEPVSTERSLRCGVCGKPYSAQGAKSGQFAYYVCASLFREGAGACTARYLNATRSRTS